MWLSRCQSSRRTSKAGNPALTKQSQSPRLASADCHGVNSSNHIALSCQQLSQSPWLLWTVWSHAPWPQHATPGMHFLRCLQTVTPLSHTPAPCPKSQQHRVRARPELDDVGAVVGSLWAYLDGTVLASGTQAGAGGLQAASWGPAPWDHGSTEWPWFCGNGRALGRLCSAATFLLLHKREAFFSGLYLHFPNQKCPNQMGQVATGNHSSKPFFFFPFLSETSRKRKVNDMSVGLMHTASSAPHTQMEQSRERAQTVSSGGKPAFPAVTGLGARWSGLGAVGVKRR